MAEAPIYCFIEIPKGSRNKYEYDHELKAIKLDRFLFSSMVYPTDYGFIPETLAGDGDPLDVCVCVASPTFPGCRLYVRAIGVLVMSDAKGKDDKVVCVPYEDPAWDDVRELEDLSRQLRAEIEHFFAVYKQLEGETVEIEEWRTRAEAQAVIAEARERFATSLPA